MTGLTDQNDDEGDIEEIFIAGNGVNSPQENDMRQPPQHIFQNGIVTPESCIIKSELTGNIPLSKIWWRQFGKGEETVMAGWRKFRQDSIYQYEEFEKKLICFEHTLNDMSSADFLEEELVMDKLNEIDAIISTISEVDKEFNGVSMTYEQFSTYLPRGENRKKVDDMIECLRQRYFNFLLSLYKKKEMLNCIIPRLQKYKFSSGDVKNWLDSVELRSKFLFSNVSNNVNILPNEGRIDQIVEEIHAKKDVYEDFLEFSKEINSIFHNFNDDQPESNQLDVNEMVPRWDSFCENIEKCLQQIKLEQKAAAYHNKSEMEKIDIEVRAEMEKCTCLVPFKIVKVGDGKYTFGSSKTVRLLRIHGSSIVIRIGGGWEYLYNFLLKVDPCRAKQHVTPTNRDTPLNSTSGAFVTSLDNEDTPVAKPSKPSRRSSAVAIPRYLTRSNDSNSEPKRRSSAIVPPRHLNRALEIVSTPDDQLQKCFDSSSSSESTPSSPAPQHKKTDSKTDLKSENKPERKTRRLSLVDRQSLYKQKLQYKSVDIDY